MEDHREKWVSVPAFGGWEKKNCPHRYSIDFSQAREARRQNKACFTLFKTIKGDDSLGDQRGYHLSRQRDRLRINHRFQPLCLHFRLTRTKTKIMSYFNRPKMAGCLPTTS